MWCAAFHFLAVRAGTVLHLARDKLPSGRDLPFLFSERKDRIFQSMFLCIKN